MKGDFLPPPPLCMGILRLHKGKKAELEAHDVYPRVKVRLDDKKAPCKEDSTVLLLKLCLQTKPFSKVPVRVTTVHDQNKPQSPGGTHQPRARISKSQNLNSKVPSMVKVSNNPGKSDKVTQDDNRTNIRASSAPRPRAILSSPDNDGMIGNINRKTRERPTIINKTQVTSQNTVPERKPMIRSISTGRLASRTKSSKEDCNNNNLKGQIPFMIKTIKAKQRVSNVKDNVRSLRT